MEDGGWGWSGVEQFLNDLYASGDKLFCKFCQHYDDWKRVDMCKDHVRSKARVKNKEDTMLCTLSNGQISVKGHKNSNISVK